jgi:ribosomal peptide maturation radical SAM protein 1
MLVELAVRSASEAENDVHSEESTTDSFRVSLVCMPFASARLPSIQVGLMTAIAEEAGFSTDAYYFNLDLAAKLAPDLYERLCEHRGRMTGEWLFGTAAFGPLTPTKGADYLEVYPEEVAWAQKIGKDREFLLDLRYRVLPEFIDECFVSVDWSAYSVVGFSSTFQQNVACLALASRIKKQYPDVVTIFGGANMEAEMGPECARAFPFIDYVVSGEGDQAFPTLLSLLAARKPVLHIPGVTFRTSDDLRTAGQAAPFRNLDASPIPNYAAYFECATRLGLFPHYKSDWVLPFESSRGCWWGEKHHCTFCGLNGLGMSYRAKSPDRVLAEISALMRKHGVSSFEAIDNILDLKYLPTFFTQIEQAKSDYLFFYEVKANLTRAQIQSLYKGGVRCIQAGLESMSSHVLQLMRKGCTMLQNVRCLKWCAYYGIRVGWNLLWGFPGETEEDYQRQLDILQCISHLEPPRCTTKIWLERFSPYYSDQAKFQLFNVRPEGSYYYVYPEHVDIGKVAYFFDYEMRDVLPAKLHRATESYVSEWQQRWNSEQRHSLSYRRMSDGLLLDYKRGSQSQGTYTLLGPLSLIYEFCVETMQTPKHVAEYLRKTPERYEFSEEEVRDAMDEFCHARLMLSEEGRYLSLAIPSNPNW